jgi:hypothetical protein
MGKRILLAALAVCAACGVHRMPGDGDGSDTLSVSPPTSSLQVLNGSAATQTYTATLVHADGTSEDVTADTTFGINELGLFTGDVLSVTEGGKAQVTGLYGGDGSAMLTGNAEVLVNLQSTRIDPSLPPTTPGLFNGSADPTRTPVIVYPPVGAIMPRNVGDFEVHWTDASNNNIWEISLHTTYSEVDVYLPASTPANFMDFLPAEWTSAVGNENTVTFEVRGVSTSSPGLVGAAPPQSVGLSNEQMLGGLYYWAAEATGSGSDAAYGIFRHDMSTPETPAQEYMTTDQTAGRCVACHVLSTDGTKMAITYDGGGDEATFVDVASGSAQAGSNHWDFGAFTPDGSEFFSIENGQLVLRDYTTQAIVIPTVPTPANMLVTHVETGPDGTLVYSAYPAATNSGDPDWSVLNSTIVTQAFDQQTGTFGTPDTIVSDANNNYYPSFSPDGQWVLFNKDTDGGTSYNDASTELWVIKADGSAPAVRLANAEAAAGQTNSWGRWAPFPQTYGSSGEAMYWITVSSKRNFGVRLVGVAEPQLWMSPFFADRAAAGMDPSVPMFWLPFQNINSHNHIAQWTQAIVGIDVRGR